MDQGHLGGMVLQKAFDTVGHNIYLMKLEALCLIQDVSKWFWSYLSDLQHPVDIPGTLFSHAIILCGVPQRSILGPLSFSIYVMICLVLVRSNKLLLYADDSAISVEDTRLPIIETILQNELEVVSK